MHDWFAALTVGEALALNAAANQAENNEKGGGGTK